jgi:hypothetical protein
VNQEGKLVGILSFGDVARYHGANPDLDTDGVSSEVVADTVAAISEARHVKSLSA